jgi:hypothetical protein
VSVRLALAAVAVVALAGGCGGGDDGDGGGGGREAVAAYVDDANAIQAELRVPLAAAERAYADFASGDTDLAEVRPRLAESERTIRALGRRLAQLQPPPEAKHLHALLLGLVQAQVELAHEVEGLAAFLPKFEQRLGSLRPAERRLRTALAAARTAESQAAAIDRYGEDVGAVLRGLETLQPPEVMAAAYATQVDTLAKVRRSSVGLAKALRNDDAQVLPARLRQFADAAGGSGSVAAQRSHIEAVKLYNRRVSRLGTLADRVDRERGRLQRTLG